VVIHCVRAYDLLLKVKRNFPRIPYWAVHGYARHDVLAKTLVDQGFHLSLAPERSSHAGLLATVKALPLERLFLETDSAHWQDIVDVYNFVAEWRGMPLPELQATIAENCKTFFQK
jgi:TatD DNase family protein